MVAGLAGVVVIGWFYLLIGAGLGTRAIGTGAGQRTMAMAPSWTPAYAALVFVMWAVMMAAMMLPSAAPTILLVSALSRNRAAAGSGAPSAAFFALGYLSVWAGFSLAATLLQWALSRLGLLLPEGMIIGNGILAGAILVAAGLYQWAPLKRACLAHCRSPLDFLMRYWRKGTHHALACGARHGAFCRGLLLDADGPAVCRRVDESHVDRRSRRAGADREDAAVGRLDQPPHWRRLDRLGHRDRGRRCSSLSIAGLDRCSGATRRLELPRHRGIAGGRKPEVWLQINTYNHLITTSIYIFIF